MCWWFIRYNMLTWQLKAGDSSPLSSFWCPCAFTWQSLHWITCRRQHEAAAVCCCIDPYVLAHARPSSPVCLSRYSKPSLLNGPRLDVPAGESGRCSFPFIRHSSVLWCFSAANHHSLAICWHFYPVFSPIRQKGYSLIVHGSFLHPVCYIDSPTFFFSSPVPITARLLPWRCALIYTGAFLLTLGGASLLSFHPSSFSFIVLIPLLYFCLLHPNGPSLSLSLFSFFFFSNIFSHPCYF